MSMGLEEVIERLTENGKYANELCLMLLVSDNEIYLRQLDSIGITGKELEIFAYKCCNDGDIRYIQDTLLCISFGIFDLPTVYKNLQSKNPLPFIKDIELPSDTHIQ